MANNSLTILTNRFFALVLKSPIQMGWLSIIDSVTNISRLGTFKPGSQPRIFIIEFQSSFLWMQQLPFVILLFSVFQWYSDRSVQVSTDTVQVFKIHCTDLPVTFNIINISYLSSPFTNKTSVYLPTMSFIVFVDTACLSLLPVPRALGFSAATAKNGLLVYLGLLNYIDTKAKCRHIKKFTCKGTLRQVFICLRPPSLQGFCLGWSSNFVGSEYCQIQSVKLLQNMVSNELNTPHPLPATHCL